MEFEKYALRAAPRLDLAQALNQEGRPSERRRKETL
jgi:hypothetical protein